MKPGLMKYSLLPAMLLSIMLAMASFAASAAPVTYKIDPAHTVVLVSWTHFGYSHPSANFAGAQGSLSYDAANVAASKVEVTLPLSGLDSFVPKLDEHLKSAEFFDAQKYPQITFKSTRVRADGAHRLKVTGDLTVHGVTHPAVLDVVFNKAAMNPMMKANVIGFDATTKLKRSDFGVGAYVPNVGDEITIRITTEADAAAG